MDGRSIKYDKLRRVQRNGIEHNSIALALPVYRNLVYRTSDVIIEYLQKFVEDTLQKTGRPGVNKIAVPYIQEIGIEKATAVAVATVVNNFHRALSRQSLSLKIGASLSQEWAILQEDPALVNRILNKVHKGSNTTRRKIYLLCGLRKTLDRPLQSIPQVARAALGNLFISLLVDAEMLDDSTKSRRGLTMLVASQNVLDYLERGINREADKNPIILPNLTPETADVETLFRPQRGSDVSLSSAEPDSIFHRACNALNQVPFTICVEQYEFLRSIASYSQPVLGLPGNTAPELPEYLDGMTEDQQKAVRTLRAKTYADRLVWRSKRTNYLSALHGLKQYLNKDVYFNVQADFRGRIYPCTELLSYQGPDWLRSMWKFTNGKPISNEKEAEWLYIHVANCYGLSRQSFGVRRAFVVDNRALITRIAEDPENLVHEIEKAEQPFRFLAAAREVAKYWRHGSGFITHLPVQMDASSQGIQIWSAISGDVDLMNASNVLDTGGLRDIYQELADQIYDTARQSSDPGTDTIRNAGVSRKTAKSALMVLPYGGKFTAILDAVDRHNPDWPREARVWLSKRLWHDGRDALHSLVKVQEKLAEAVSRHLVDTGEKTLKWTSPAGVNVVQKYNQTQSMRVKNMLGQSVYKYHFETDEPNIHKHATAIAPNILHSLDSSLLCRAIVDSCDHGITSIMPIHDCFGVLSPDATKAHGILKEAFRWAVTPKLKWVDFAPEGVYNGASQVEGASDLSDYLFS